MANRARHFAHQTCLREPIEQTNGRILADTILGHDAGSETLACGLDVREAGVGLEIADGAHGVVIGHSHR